MSVNAPLDVGDDKVGGRVSLDLGVNNRALAPASGRNEVGDEVGDPDSERERVDVVLNNRDEAAEGAGVGAAVGEAATTGALKEESEGEVEEEEELKEVEEGVEDEVDDAEVEEVESARAAAVDVDVDAELNEDICRKLE